MSHQNPKAPPIEELLSRLGLRPMCEHEILLTQVGTLLAAAAMRHGGQLIFTPSELEDAQKRVLAINGTPAGVRVQALIGSVDSPNAKAQNAPTSESVQ